jgi:hypothetical protein
MEVLCVRGSRFLIKGEWYKVSFPFYDLSIHNGETLQLMNHTNIHWNTSWYHKNNFINKQEFREQQLNKILR